MLNKVLKCLDNVFCFAMAVLWGTIFAGLFIHLAKFAWSAF